MSRFSLNQATIKYADLETAVRVTADAGIESIGLWREPVAAAGLEHSARVGVLAVEESERLAGALELQSMVIGDLVRTGSRPTAVEPDATVADVRAAAVRSGHSAGSGRGR